MFYKEIKEIHKMGGNRKCGRKWRVRWGYGEVAFEDSKCEVLCEN